MVQKQHVTQTRRDYNVGIGHDVACSIQKQSKHKCGTGCAIIIEDPHHCNWPLFFYIYIVKSEESGTLASSDRTFLGPISEW